MNKGLGATFSAMLLAGFLFQSKPGSTPPTSQLHTTSSQSEAKAVTGEGPWIASCQYWAAARTIKPSDREKSPDFHLKLDITGSTIKSYATGSADAPASACTGDPTGWGLPGLRPGVAPDIRFIIATVPDPVHTHLALDFDRAVDAILLAAADNQYLNSYYWLPWRNRNPSSTTEPTGSATTEDNNKREKQPGLIILRYEPAANDSESELPQSGYYRVIYLFLVGETPALGINGDQLQNAFQYVKKLQDLCSKPPYSCKPLQHGTSIIGPLFSGSAASLHRGIETGKVQSQLAKVDISGITGTDIASRELGQDAVYRSFGENTGYESRRLLQSLMQSGYDPARIAILSEENTVFAGAVERSVSDNSDGNHKWKNILRLRFSRDLSVLRNAQTSQTSPSSAPSSPPSPYLNLSLKDAEGDDTVPDFSLSQSPLSLEAQLMAIAHQLQRARSQFVFISATSVLDDIFLAQFLHRACPDARLVFFSGDDLLFERDVDNAPYVGSITVTPYLLTSLRMTGDDQRLHPDHRSEGLYNAASYTFWSMKDDKEKAALPKLMGYESYPNQWKSRALSIPLWSTVLGTDGYYPMGILDWRASDNENILPSFGSAKACVVAPWNHVPASIGRNSGISPTLTWMLLDGFIIILCCVHGVLLLSAEYWSPLTRDLAIRQNDEPFRRAVSLNIGAAVLVAMAYVMAYPVFRIGQYYPRAFGFRWEICLTGLGAVFALVVTLFRTGPYLFQRKRYEYVLFNTIAALSLTVIVVGWRHICINDSPAGSHSYAGLFFSYRCLNPLNGVCPMVPILLLLFSWYLWAICKTARLRFSTLSRPRLPGSFVPDKHADTPFPLKTTRRSSALSRLRLPSFGPSNQAHTPFPLFIADDTLAECSLPTDACLFQNITCMFITREILRRFLRKVPPIWLNSILLILYLALFSMCVLVSHVYSVDRFLFNPLPSRFGKFLFSLPTPTPYEFLITALFFPLIMIALSCWLRAILIWGALNRHLLEPLERYPIRFAFCRHKGGSWVSMLNESGLFIRWRDMSRTTESIRQLLNHRDLRVKYPKVRPMLSSDYVKLNHRISTLYQRLRQGHVQQPSTNNPPSPPPRPSLNLFMHPRGHWDIPPDGGDIFLIYSIERRYAKFCQDVIRFILAPHWDSMRTGFVEEVESAAASKTGSATEKPDFIHLAEELIVTRYIALIRAVLVNIRYLLLFVSASFVLALVAWNSYPFQPRAFIDWCFTVLLALITFGFIAIFAQMHRNPILSRITDTAPNELGAAFYVRIITFGAVPVLTWLAYQFPEIGGSLFRIFQPGLQVMK
ncbi:hypothetical protein [Tunturiibacter gelidiferens]|uniref:hypothetical protein n=1 Tax=Tunturiibacter gelidiferens TaxID=3069689 RepID=UPI003D9B5ECE